MRKKKTTGRLPLGRVQLSSDALYAMRCGYNGVTPQQRQPRRRCGDGNDAEDDEEGDGEGDGMPSSAAARRNASPMTVKDKDGVARRGHNSGTLRQRRMRQRRGDGVRFFESANFCDTQGASLGQKIKNKNILIFC